MQGLRILTYLASPISVKASLISNTPNNLVRVRLAATITHRMG